MSPYLEIYIVGFLVSVILGGFVSQLRKDDDAMKFTFYVSAFWPASLVVLVFYVAFRWLFYFGQRLGLLFHNPDEHEEK